MRLSFVLVAKVPVVGVVVCVVALGVEESSPISVVVVCVFNPTFVTFSIVKFPTCESSSTIVNV